jgi:PAS domain S-box-containing protein
MGEPPLSATLDAPTSPPDAVTAASPEQLLAIVIAALRQDRDSLAALIETLPAPIYLTDAEGVVIHFNQACIAFTGRTPVVGEDRWCVSWRLYDESGAPLPHDRCPMAIALKRRRPVRSVVAVAERPDGSRVMFIPYPTPIFGADGKLLGAVNLLVDTTSREQADALRAQARRCRRLASSIMDQRTVDTLLLMAAEYEDRVGDFR